MDINKALRTAINTGDVRIGLNETRKAIADGKARLVIVSSNIQEENLTSLKKDAKTAFYSFNGTNMDLGFACGKPFSISVMTVLKPGESDVLALKDE